MDRLLWMAYPRSLALATEVTQEIFAMFKYAYIVNGTLKIHFSERAMLESVNSLSDRKVIECRDIGLFTISKSISCRTSHIEYIR